MKIVINDDWGGFSLSDKAIERYAELAGINLVKQVKDDSFWGAYYYNDEIKNENLFSDYEISRDDGFLIQVVEELGEEANGSHASLKVVEIPENVEWEINDYDGVEHIAEKHRTWR
jgi:hypothetical protein